MYDIKDKRGVPVSAGVPRIVTISVLLIVVLVIAILGIVVGASRFGHVWPSTDSARIKL